MLNGKANLIELYGTNPVLIRILGSDGKVYTYIGTLSKLSEDRYLITHPDGLKSESFSLDELKNIGLLHKEASP